MADMDVAKIRQYHERSGYCNITGGIRVEKYVEGKAPTDDEMAEVGFMLCR